MINETPFKPFASAADQNKHDILAVLADELQDSDKVLELGSGTGQHLCYFALHLPGVTWQPTELASKLAGIELWQAEVDCSNLRKPVVLDVCSHPWPRIDATVCYTANTFHIVSMAAVESVFSGCEKVLSVGGRIIVYGPFQFDGVFTAESNARFDQMLRASDPDSGVRDMQELDELAVKKGFKPARVINMPVNNFMAVWEKA